ncbi:uncharacterized protein K460DRAFT_397621 [Cucurbitaria berberidis CBS 394.84]|uniref:Uncharacterized protein n=1 Tax=Cucurbitaria berberidis CBS 394.84 TaxID=1168544 RepID=A0A9P4G996_9PLEO|nr:uncharacterized protein K460DRAFT_397621 [Cucurbitaria berberidis CBS 394.84]KAF1841381.1 hypothetical protein K460DRAFT_397621 [Cucurbitaria berberidis CBS 394.84]
MVSTKQIPALVMGLVSLASAAPAAVEVRAEVPEVIPGPGMPSLQSLGLTSEYLYSLGKPDVPSDEMSILVDPRCSNNYGNVNNAIACYNYLRSLGQRQCGVPDSQRSIIMCSTGNVRIEGHGIGASSWCEHVAVGVLWTIDHCTRPQQDTSGFAPAYGNGGLIIYTGS